MSRHIHIARKHLARGVVCSGILTGLMLLATGYTGLKENSAWLVKKKTAEIPWLVLSPEDVERGASVPPNTNVVFHLPDTFERITRDVLFGAKSDQFRYWGYCIPENYDPEKVARRTGLPGELFLSEAERAYRADLEARHKPQFSIFKLPSRSDIEAYNKPRVSGVIRHQVEVFTPNLVCYIMSEAPISIGMDPDEDGLNNKLESDALTEIDNEDTDGDGVMDGIEVVYNIDPLLKDTDGDNLIDGLEDRNFNGKVDYGEPNPRKKDTDLDNLCDGSCRMQIGNSQVIFYGEDNDLSGDVGEHETDPTVRDTNGDGVTDYQAFFNCMAGAKEYCL